MHSVIHFVSSSHLFFDFWKFAALFTKVVSSFVDKRLLPPPVALCARFVFDAALHERLRGSCLRLAMPKGLSEWLGRKLFFFFFFLRDNLWPDRKSDGPLGGQTVLVSLPVVNAVLNLHATQEASGCGFGRSLASSVKVWLVSCWCRLMFAVLTIIVFMTYFFV